MIDLGPLERHAEAVVQSYDQPHETVRLAIAVADLAGEVRRLRQQVRSLMGEIDAARRPRPPGELVGALHDRTHPTSGRLLSAKPVAP